VRRVIRWLFIAGGLGLIVLSLTGAVLFKTTSQSNFCNKCHLMEPYYQSWQRSKHAKVECTACHMPPDIAGKVLTKFQALTQLTKYLTRTWGTRPWGHVTDASCLECHDLEKLKNQKLHPFRPGLRFNHAPHLADKVRGRKLLCTTCHKQVERSVHMEIATQACYTCHFKAEPGGEASRLGDCKTCHVAGEVHLRTISMARRDSADCTSCHKGVVSGEGDAPSYRCMQCHNDRDVLKIIEKPDDVHAIHVSKAGADCFNCHTQILHRRPVRAPAPESIDCQQCHGTSHEPQIRLFTGRMVPKGTPSAMFRAGLQCSSCHVTGVANGKPKLDLKPSACAECHSPKLMGRYQGWMETTLKLADGLAAKAGEVRARDPKLAGEVTGQLERLREARPVHNFPHALEVLEDVDRKLRALLPALAPLPHKAWSGAGGCAQCHYPTLATITYYQGRPFSHEAHRGQLAVPLCTACHDNQPHGALKPVESCRTCHHQKEPPKGPMCGSCHAREKEIFSGKVAGLDVKPIWSDEKKCKDCHQREGGKADAPELWVGCAGCHDPGYDTQMKDKLKGFAARKAKLPPGAGTLRQLLESDRSGGAHHPALYDKVLEMLEKGREGP
jgi:nitrate/TMAO reductase-like tetraheme cytochrome c subunit